MALLFQRAALPLATRTAEPAPLMMTLSATLLPLISRVPPVVAVSMAVVPAAVVFCEMVTWVALSMLRM